MLTYLSIKNLATISHLELEFESGLCAITGETGAGKSVLIGALGLVLGERADADAVRSGAEAAEIEAVFGNIILSEELALSLELPRLVDELVIQRRVRASGGSRCRINGQLASVATLAELGNILVDLHGQHDHQALLHETAQLELLDAYTGTATKVEAVGGLYRSMKQAENKLNKLETASLANDKQLALWRYELAEIEAAELFGDEEETLLAERKRLRSVVELGRLGEAALSLLNEGDNTVLERLDEAIRLLTELQQLDGQAGYSKEITEARYTIESAVTELQRYHDGLQADPARLDEVEERLAAIEHLKRKYGGSVMAVLAQGRWLGEQLTSIDNRGAALDEHRQLLAKARDEYLKEARQLSDSRNVATERLVVEVNEVLGRLGFAGEPFSIALESPASDATDWVAQARPTGLDAITMLLAANPGEPPRPLARVASGGELSRIMLALKRVTGERYGVPTMIFDEIDSGIGGHVAGVVSEVLNELSVGRQVLCITHIPHIAAVARRHYRVAKETAEGRTFTTVESLTNERRITELAAMLGGGETARDHASKLLARNAATIDFSPPLG